MFFETKAGLKPPPFTHTIYTALVIPRPIGWISTVSLEGVVNLAPYSFFNAVSGDPPCVMYCPNGWKAGTTEVKDSLTNAEATGEFVFNMCTYALRDQMNATAAHVPASVDEMAAAGLEAAPCTLVKPPRVKASPIALEGESPGPSRLFGLRNHQPHFRDQPSGLSGRLAWSRNGQSGG